MIDPPDERETAEDLRDHRDAGRLARDPALQKVARAYLAAVAAAAMRSRSVVSAHAVHLGASILVDSAAAEANRPPGT